MNKNLKDKILIYDNEKYSAIFHYILNFREMIFQLSNKRLAFRLFYSKTL
jgi:hypothetical protein